MNDRYVVIFRNKCNDGTLLAQESYLISHQSDALLMRSVLKSVGDNPDYCNAVLMWRAEGRFLLPCPYDETARFRVVVDYEPGRNGPEVFLGMGYLSQNIGNITMLTLEAAKEKWSAGT